METSAHPEWSVEGRVCLVTGANTGIGRVTAIELARAGAHVVLACRSEAKARPVLQEIAALGRGRGELLELDLASLASVRRGADELLARALPLSLLINNAGLAGQRGVTADGFELAFGVNHLGHFLLTQCLLERLTASAPARVVNVSSKSHYRAKGIDWDAVRAPTRSLSGLGEYASSKLANVLFTRELSRRYGERGLAAYALHPGVVASDIWKRLPWPLRSVWKGFLLTNEEGAETTLHCAQRPASELSSGGYYERCRLREPSALAQDDDLARALWERSAAWVAAASEG